jgi:hypothetical protein
LGFGELLITPHRKKIDDVTTHSKKRRHETFFGTDKPGSGYGQMAGFCECGDEPSASKKLRGVS